MALRASKPSKSASGFFELPMELRQEVYRNLLSTRRTRRKYGLGFVSYDLQPAILRVNRRIHQEATEIWQKNRFVHILTLWSGFKKDILEPAKFPIIAEKTADRCHIYLRIMFDFMELEVPKPHSNM